jgi:CTP:molybdopterin cytidylyltransferase MocA
MIDLKNVQKQKSLCSIVQWYIYAFPLSRSFISATFARQKDTKACIILLRIDEPSLNASIYLLKSVKKAYVLNEVTY